MGAGNSSEIAVGPGRQAGRQAVTHTANIYGSPGWSIPNVCQRAAAKLCGQQAQATAPMAK